MKKKIVVKIDGMEVGSVVTTHDYKFALVLNVGKEHAQKRFEQCPSWSKNEYKKWKMATETGWYVICYSSRHDLLEKKIDNNPWTYNHGPFIVRTEGEQ